jgi:hypothetical protein
MSDDQPKTDSAERLAVQAIWDAAWAMYDPVPNGQQWKRSQALKEAIDALIAAVEVSSVPPDGSGAREKEIHDHSAGLIHQTIPDVAGTEPRLNRPKP